MPELTDVAKHFDDIPVTDGYTGAFLFNAQFSTFRESGTDSSVSERRIMSMAPGLSAPARGVICALGEYSLIGFGVQDGIFGGSIRQSLWTRRVTDTFTKLTPGQAALASTGTDFKGHKAYLKDTVNGATNSEYDPFWDISAAPYEGLAKGDFLKAGSTYYRVRSAHLDLSGLTIASSDELDSGARVSVTFSGTGAYAPITDTYATGTTTTYGMLLDRYKWYEQLTQADRQSLAGDMTLSVATSAVTPVIGKECTIASRTWKILNVTAFSDAWELHIRRA